MSVLRRSLLAAAVTAMSLSSVAPAAALFSDAGESTTNFTVVQDARTTYGSIDYSTLGIPEAPGTLPGSTATTGIQLTANKGTAGTAAATGINLVLGSTP